MCGMYSCGSEGLDCFQNRSPGGVLQSTRSVCMASLHRQAKVRSDIILRFFCPYVLVEGRGRRGKRREKGREERGEWGERKRGRGREEGGERREGAIRVSSRKINWGGGGSYERAKQAWKFFWLTIYSLGSSTR